VEVEFLLLTFTSTLICRRLYREPSFTPPLRRNEPDPGHILSAFRSLFGQSSHFYSPPPPLVGSSPPKLTTRRPSSDQPAPLFSCSPGVFLSADCFRLSPFVRVLLFLRKIQVLLRQRTLFAHVDRLAEVFSARGEYDSRPGEPNASLFFFLCRPFSVHEATFPSFSFNPFSGEIPSFLCYPPL